MAKETAASERAKGEQKMVELHSKLEDAEAGLRNAMAEAGKATERAREMEQEVSALRSQVIQSAVGFWLCAWRREWSITQGGDHPNG